MRLHINIDHVATLRNQRDVTYPDPVAAARLCMQAGADGITVHLREDRRHIRDADVRALISAELGLINMEMAPTLEMATLCREMRPQVVTLVPEKRQEKTTEGGLDVVACAEQVSAVAAVCKECGIKLSLFIEAAPEQIRASAELGAAQVEFHTGHYCEASEQARPALLQQLEQAAEKAAGLGMEVAAGHGLTAENVGPIVNLRQIEELNIGHAVVSRAVLVGMKQAVIEMRAAMDAVLSPKG